MSIRHCIAGVVLVVIGGLAVHAYQDQPPETASKAALLQDRIRELEHQRQSPKGDIETRTIEIELAANKEALQLIEDKFARALDGVKIAGLQGAVKMLQADLKTMQKQNKPQSNSSPVGRFQFFDQSASPPNQRYGVVFDTATGHCWYLTGEQWQDIGTPTSPPINIKDAIGSIPVDPKVDPLDRLLPGKASVPLKLDPTDHRDAAQKAGEPPRIDNRPK